MTIENRIINIFECNRYREIRERKEEEGKIHYLINTIQKTSCKCEKEKLTKVLSRLEDGYFKKHGSSFEIIKIMYGEKKNE